MASCQSSLRSLRKIHQAYTNLNCEAGIFNVYTEMAVADGQLEGYVKPIITDLKVSKEVGDKKKPLKALWTTVAGLLFKVFENPKEDQFATKVPLSGDLNNTKTKIWPAIINILKNAFIEAFEKDTDNEISFQDLIQ